MCVGVKWGYWFLLVEGSGWPPVGLQSVYFSLPLLYGEGENLTSLPPELTNPESALERGKPTSSLLEWGVGRSWVGVPPPLPPPHHGEVRPRLLPGAYA